MRRVRTRRRKSQRIEAVVEQHDVGLDERTVSVAMIQALIPLGLRAVQDALQQEVTELAGVRYARQDGRPDLVRWGQQRGSVFLADQKLPVQVPRVRDRHAGREVSLRTYEQLQTPRALDVGLFRRVLGGLSCREYRQAAEAVPEAFGLAKSSVSRRFGQVSALTLQALQERRLDDAEWLVLVLDGKTFATDALVIALGVTSLGEKRILGVVQTGTENQRVCAAFLHELLERGFAPSGRLLVVLDGAKGLRAAVTTVFGTRAEVQRCQWHKRENVVSYLPKSEQALWRRKLQAAYAHPTYAAAKRALTRLERELALRNASAAASLREGLEETLTLHRLGVFPALGRSLKTTNLLENVMARVEERTARIDHWRTSDQKLRWCAAALFAVEAQFRRIKNYDKLILLERALQSNIKPNVRDAA
ncbi:MAG: IS256 family transposase [Gemmatimonadaceae bacterium]